MTNKQRQQHRGSCTEAAAQRHQQSKTSKSKTSKPNTSKCKTSKCKTIKCKTNKCKTSKSKTSKSKTNKYKTSCTQAPEVQDQQSKTSKSKTSSPACLGLTSPPLRRTLLSRTPPRLGFTFPTPLGTVSLSLPAASHATSSPMPSPQRTTIERSLRFDF
jgi:hypothetical protein